QKLAPRSSLQFKVGPQFTKTWINHQVIASNGTVLNPVIFARIDRGFEKIGEEWIGYKRNYFTLVTTFKFENQDFIDFLSGNFSIYLNNSLHQVNYFALKLISKCSEDDTYINLVQHTAKRDRGPQFAPPVYPSVPGDLPNHTVIKEAANVRNGDKIAKLDKIFYFNRNDYFSKEDLNKSSTCLSNYPKDKISKVARYERIQFASSINYRKPASSNRHFKLFVQLVAYTKNDNQEHVIAFTETPPLIIRGRSPSNY
ncbi:transcription factor NDT80, partial [Ascoidea rubescens DSM 1968]